MSGLSPNIRLQEEPEQAAIAPMDVTVENADEDIDVDAVAYGFMTSQAPF
jgi:hypothetical protein